jgi:hypothetical protein
MWQRRSAPKAGTNTASCLQEPAGSVTVGSQGIRRRTGRLAGWMDASLSSSSWCSLLCCVALLLPGSQPASQPASVSPVQPASQHAGSGQHREGHPLPSKEAGSSQASPSKKRAGHERFGNVTDTDTGTCAPPIQPEHPSKQAGTTHKPKVAKGLVVSANRRLGIR